MVLFRGLLPVVFALLFLSCVSSHRVRLNERAVYPVALTAEIKEAFLAAQRAYKNSDYPAAERLFSDFVRTYGYNRLTDRAYMYLGDISYAAGDYQAAAARYEQAFSRVYSLSISPYAQYKAALSHVRLRNYSAAIGILMSMQRKDLPWELRFKSDCLGAYAAAEVGEKLSPSAITWYLFLIDDYGRAPLVENAKKYEFFISLAQVESVLDEWLHGAVMKLAELNSFMQRFTKGSIAYSYVIYKAALTAHRDGDYSKAAVLLNEYLKIYPKLRYASEARELLSEVSAFDTGVSLKVGVLLPLSGRFAPYGKAVLAGIECAAGIYKPCAGFGNVELIIRDVGIDGILPYEAVYELAAEEVSAIVGPMRGAASLEAGGAAQNLSIPILTMTADQSVVEEGTYVFRSFVDLESEVRTLVDYAMDTAGLVSFVVMRPDNKYGDQVSGMFKDKVLAKGGSIVEEVVYTPGEVDFTDEACKAFYGTADVDLKEPKIEGRDFDAVFIPDSYKVVSYIAPTLRYVGVGEDVKLLGTSRWNNYKLIERASDYVQGAIFTAEFYPDRRKEYIRSFVDSFKSAYGRNPHLLEAEGYDVMRILLAVANRVGRDRRMIRDALFRVEEFEGVTGVINVDSNGDVSKEVELLTVVNDKIISLDELDETVQTTKDIEDKNSVQIEME